MTGGVSAPSTMPMRKDLMSLNTVNPTSSEEKKRLWKREGENSLRTDDIAGAQPKGMLQQRSQVESSHSAHAQPRGAPDPDFDKNNAAFWGATPPMSAQGQVASPGMGGYQQSPMETRGSNFSNDARNFYEQSAAGTPNQDARQFARNAQHFHANTPDETQQRQMANQPPAGRAPPRQEPVSQSLNPDELARNADRFYNAGNPRQTPNTMQREFNADASRFYEAQSRQGEGPVMNIGQAQRAAPQAPRNPQGSNFNKASAIFHGQSPPPTGQSEGGFVKASANFYGATPPQSMGGQGYR